MERRSNVNMPMDQAREILIGAVDRIIQLASSNNAAVQTPVHPGRASGSPAWSANVENQSQSQPGPTGKY